MMKNDLIFFIKYIVNYRKNIRLRRDISVDIKSGIGLKKLGPNWVKRWEPRIQLVQKSSDNRKIYYDPNAGTFNKHYNFIMHNGLLIDPMSYCGIPMLELLFKNKGVHEPQEEYVFQEVLKKIPKSAVMIELGSYWSFYSMWFNKIVEDPSNFMIEPEFLDEGVRNFRLNRLKGDFTRAFVSDSSSKSSAEVRTVSMDDFMKEKNIGFVDILHSDIQGFEFKMLEGSQSLLDEKNVGYIFISTHSNELHYDCMNLLKSKGYLLVCSCDIDETYSYDGLLVFKNPDYSGIDNINVSKRNVKALK